ncbi:hypothetical protein CUU80_08570 [Bifidobacterium scaligerum]|uniref:Glycosyltransferase n=1 Tax=Bifidobacterium scaligerum TaxID=2052656 RepID=A0A2M9HPC8_9BIFI|nr:hypothetical protein CUU80_08570 [Bifidobacterium scaligerum]
MHGIDCIRYAVLRRGCEYEWEKNVNSTIKRCAIALILCLFCEVFVFNLAFWSSRDYEPIQTTVSVGEGLEQIGDFTYRVTDADTATLDFQRDDIHVDNVHIPLVNVDAPRARMEDPSHPGTKTVGTASGNGLLKIRIETNDAGHSAAKLLPETSLNGKVPQSQWIRMRLAGHSTAFVIHVTSPVGTVFQLSGEPQLNVPRPFMVNPIRIAAYLIIIFLAATAPRLRRHWSATTDRERALYWIGTSVLGVLLVGAVTLVTRPWESLRTSTWPPDFEYQWIARSIVSGHTWLDYPVSDTLQAMANPYDSDARIAAHQQSGETYLIDFVYFNGHYYSYFGVLPCVLFFIPYLLLTGNDLAPWKVVLLLGIVLALLSVTLVRLLFKRWGANVPMPLQALAGLAAVCAVQPTMYLSFMSTIYAVPIVSGLSLIIGAICLWMKAALLERGKLYWVLIALGGILIGLNVGCRPPMCIAVFLAPIILFRAIDGQDRRSGKRSIGRTVRIWLINAFAVALPSLLAALPFLWWNKVRFGSYTEFGAAYQLTGHDMRATVGGIARFPYAIWQGLLSPANVRESFPFLTVVSDTPYFAGDYQGFYGVEPRAGGLLFWAPLGFVALALLAKRIRRAVDRDVVVLAVASLAMGVAVLFIDVLVATLTTRYLSDFGYLFVIGGTLSLIAWGRSEEQFDNRIAYRVGAFLCLLTLLLAIGSVFMTGRYSQLMDTNPEMFTMARVAFSVFA